MPLRRDTHVYYDMRSERHAGTRGGDNALSASRRIVLHRVVYCSHAVHRKRRMVWCTFTQIASLVDRMMVIEWGRDTQRERETWYFPLPRMCRAHRVAHARQSAYGTHVARELAAARSGRNVSHEFRPGACNLRPRKPWPTIIVPRSPCSWSRCPYSCSSSTAWDIRTTSPTGWTLSATTTSPAPCYGTWCTTSSPGPRALSCSSSDRVL